VFYYGSVAEGLAFLQASDEDWAGYAAAIAKAAAERDDEP
jgi:hypothetical protein